MKDANRLTLEEKVGQLFILGFQGHALDPETREILKRIRPGGVVFFQRNFESLDQIYRLTESFLEISSVPTFLAVTQEGGRVDRLKQVFAPMPAISKLAASGTAAVRSGARIIASELQAAGFNTVFAPILDLSDADSVLAGRTFGASPGRVSRLAAAFVEEVSRKNVISCAKHFPGMGSAKLDPHFVLPTINRCRQQLQQEDVLPFLSLRKDVGMIMTAHAHYPGLGDEKPVPASLSSRILDGFLRKKIGYEGIIVTDDLAMGAVARLGLTPGLFLKAFEAGNDMLLFSQSTPLVEQAFRAIAGAARNSTTLRDRLDRSVARILEVKSRIHYMPLRYRTQFRPRIIRQIEKLQASIAAQSEQAPVM